VDLARLLAPRRVRLVGGGRSEPGRLVRGRCAFVRRGEADLALVLATPRGLQAALGQAARAAPVVLVVRPGEARDDPLPPAGVGLVLGPGAAIWSPKLTAGIHAPGGARRRPRGPRPCLVLAESSWVAGRLLAAAWQRGLRPLGALSSGAGAGWVELALAAARLEPAPLLLLALHRQPSLADLARLASAGPETVLLLAAAAAPARGWPGPAGFVRPDAAQAARALGLIVAGGLQQAAEVARLRELGLPGGDPAVMALASGEAPAALMRQALDAAGLTPAAATGSAAPEVQRIFGASDVAARLAAGRRRGPLHAVVADPDVPRPARIPQTAWLAFDPAGADPGGGATTAATLGALAALQGVAATPAPASRSRQRGEALALLDSWGADLGELQVKRLLRCRGIQPPPEELVGSASAAGLAARRIGPPVVLRALTAGSPEAPPAPAVVTGVATEAAARQAFRDLLHQRGAGVRPALELEGVMVGADPGTEPGPALRLAVVWPPDAPPLMSAALDTRVSPAPSLTRPCPLSQETALKVARQLERAGFSVRPPARRRLATLLSRLGRLASDLQGRMAWLQLTLVAGPPDRDGPWIMEGGASQLLAYRSPRLF
jgi:hypothetical protein